MYSLITACIEIGDATPLTKVDKLLLSENEVAIVDFIFSYRSKYDAIPTVEIIIATCPYFVPFKPSSEPIRALIDRAIKRKQLGIMRALINDAILEIDEGNVPYDLIEQMTKITAYSHEADSFTSYDRERYIRTSRLYTGFGLIDRLTGGLSDGEVMILSGRLGTGKSTLSQYVAYQWWKQGKKVMYVSTEMLTADIFSRMDGFMTGYNPRVFRSGSSNPDVANAIKKINLELGSIEKTGEVIVPRLQTKTPQAVFTLAENMGVDAVVLDGFYLMTPDGGNSKGSNWEKVQAISNQIKQNAQSSGIPAIAVTQIKRNSAGKTSGIYDTEDLAFSDSIGQDADAIVVVSPDSVEPELVELQLIKNRFGPIGSMQIKIDFDSMQITDMSSMRMATEPVLDKDGSILSAW